MEQTIKNQNKSKRNIEDKIKRLIPLYLLNSGTDFNKPILNEIRKYQKANFRQDELSYLIEKYSNDFKTQIGLIVSLGLSKGWNQSKMLTEVLTWWKQPSVLVGLDNKVFHQGKGISTSAFNNLLNVSDSEILLDYRRMEFLSNKDAGGVEVYPSQGHIADICDEHFGVYPPDYFFTGIHLRCRCLTRPVKTKVTTIPTGVKKLVTKNDFLYKYNTKYFK